MPRSWKSQIADEVRATSMMKPKWPDDAMAHIASLQADNDRLRQLLSEAEKRESEARAKALEEAAQVAARIGKRDAYSDDVIKYAFQRGVVAAAKRFSLALTALQSEER